ncbi:ankyrin [Hypoxylon sp. FL0543]|nr:ankyrin [Hypoxylon sp. FL0543]
MEKGNPIRFTMGLLQFPNELLAHIAEYLTIDDISSLHRACRDLHTALGHFLYRRLRGDSDVFHWAVEHRNIQLVRKLLEAGAHPDQYVLKKSHRGTQHSRPPAGSDYSAQLLMLEEQCRQRYEIASGRTRSRRGESPPSEPWMTAMHLAASLGYDDMIELLLDYGANVNAISQGFCDCTYLLGNEDNSTVRPFWMPLHTAMCHGNDTTARILLARGASFQIAPRPIGSSRRYVTALHTSCYTGALEISRLLLEKLRCPQIDIEDHQGLTPLAWAYKSHQWDTVEWLVQNGASIDTHGGNGRSLLWDACYHWRPCEAYRLLELGANPRYYIGTSPLHYICYFRHGDTDTCVPPGFAKPIDRLTLVKRLVKAGADIGAKRPLDQATPLILAAAAVSAPLVEYLLDAGADINSQDLRGFTPLMHACSPTTRIKDSRLSTIKLLLDRGASTTLVDKKGWMALEHLCKARRGHPDDAAIVRLLIEHGSPPNAMSDRSISLIREFFLSDDPETSKYLRTVGSRLPDEDDLMEMLDHAIKNDDVDALRFVLEFEGATALLCTETRLFDALDCGHHDVAEIIFDAGAPWTYTRMGATCLFFACRSNKIELVRKLLRVGADPNCFTEYGGSPLTVAIEYGNVSIFEALLDHGADPFPSRINSFTHKPQGGALLRAILREEVEIVDAIMKRGLYNSAPAAEQIRSMYFVCDQEPSPASLALLEALLRGGADPNMCLLHPPTADYCLPLQVVRSHENHKAAELLHSYGATRLPPEALWKPLSNTVNSL